MADCHNEQTISVVQALANGANPQLRKTALTVLGSLGPNSAPTLLACLETDRSVEEQAIVMSALRGMEGPGVDDLLLKALVSAGAVGIQIDLIRLLDSRGVVKAAPEILKLAAGPSKEVSIAALSAMRSLASLNELPVLVSLVRSSADGEVREASENAVVGVCSRSGEAASESVLNELKHATKASERNSWTSVLARVGYAKALPTIEASASDPDSEVAANAITQLGHWPNPAPVETLLKTMDSGSSPDLRKRALESVLDLATTASDEAKPPSQLLWAGFNAPTRVRSRSRTKSGSLGCLAV